MANQVEINGSEAALLDGKVASGEIRAQLKAEIAEIQKENPAFVPGLAIVQVCRSAMRLFICNKELSQLLVKDLEAIDRFHFDA